MAHDVVKPPLKELGDLDVFVLEQKPIVDLSAKILEFLNDLSTLLPRHVPSKGLSQ